MSSSRSSHSSSVSSGITRTSEYDREYRRQDRRLLYEVVERATNAYLNSAETMNLSMNLTIDFIDASANSISVMPGVEYRAPRINISFDKLKHGRSKEAPRSETKSVSGQSISEVSISRISPDSSTTPEKRAAGGASRGNLHKKSEAELRIEDFDDFEEFERGARDDRPAYRKKMADGNEMASLRRGLAVRRRLPTGDPFPVIQESAEVGKRGEALEPKSFWSKKVDDEFTIEQSKLTRDQIEKWMQSSKAAAKLEASTFSDGVACDPMEELASIVGDIALQGPWGSVSETDVFENGDVTKRVQCGGNFIKLHKDD